MSNEFLKALEGWKSPFLGRLSVDSEVGEQVVSEDLSLGAIVIDSNATVPIKELFHQVLKVRQITSGKSAYLRRTVARLENGNEIDIAEPMALDTELVETGIDTSKCAACELKIVSPTDLQIHEGRAYHSYCLTEPEEENN